MGKVYAVRTGASRGIFHSWAECQVSVKGYPKAEYKSFSSVKEARAYLGDEFSNSAETKSSTTRPNVKEGGLVAYVDGSYDVLSRRYGYGAIAFTEKDQKEFSGSGTQADLVAMRNVSGELLATMAVMQYACQLGVKYLDLYYDYEGIEQWALLRWKRNNVYTKRYAEYMQKRMAKIEVTFHKVVAHTGDVWNEYVDDLAKRAAGVLPPKKTVSEE